MTKQDAGKILGLTYEIEECAFDMQRTKHELNNQEVKSCKAKTKLDVLLNRLCNEKSTEVAA